MKGKDSIRFLVGWAVITVGLAGFPVFQRVVLKPLYDAGVGDGWMVMVNRAASMLLLPGKNVIYKIAPPQDHYFSTAGVVGASLINVVFYGAGVSLVMGLLRAARLKRRARGEAKVNSAPAQIGAAPLRGGVTRREFLAGSAGYLVVAGAAAAAAYPVLVTPGRLRVRRLQIPLRGLPPSLRGLTIAHVTDVHHDEWISLDHVRRCVAMTNALRPDIIALTGDYVTSEGRRIRPVVEALAGLKPRIATVGCLGNHDWWTDAPDLRRQFDRAGIPLIDNDRVIITPNKRIERHGSAGLCLAAVGDMWEDAVDPEKALHGIPDAMPRIMMSHNPDAAEADVIRHGTPRIDLMLSGHTHGGQVRLPGMGTPVVPSSYGGKYAQGLVEGPACRVQVSAGVGLAMLPVRFNVPPEIVLMELVEG